jgi:hypothetical protein
VGIGDGIRRFFAKKNNPALKELEVFLSERKGVEGYIEPRTATQPTTLLLVDRDGDHIRGEVADPADAARFCDKNSVPVYDAQVIGYPKRMKDFERRRKSGVPQETIDERFAELEKQFSDDPE